MNLNKEQQKIYDQRKQVYGDGIFNHEQVGLMWTGILQCYFQTKLPAPIPSHIVSLMMSAVKVSRIAEGCYQKDDYTDAIIYLHIAEKGAIK